MQTKGKHASAQRKPVEVYLKKKAVPIMAPPKVGAPIQTTRKTKSILRDPHETAKIKKEMAKREVIFNVDAIPSRRSNQ